MKMLKVSGVLIAAILAASSAQADWSGTYTSTSILDGWTHSETDLVSGLNASGTHTFTDGYAVGSFEWTGTLTASPDWSDGVLTGSGMIHNNGDRAFTITDGGLWLDTATNIYHLWWNATDPLYGPIGWETFMAASVPEPEAYAMLLVGIGLVSAVVRRRKHAQV